MDLANKRSSEAEREEQDEKMQTNRQNSPLLRLPLELRFNVYEFALHNQKVVALDSVDQQLSRDESGDVNHHGLALRNTPSLLYTCKQIHDEVRKELPRLVMFDICHSTLLVATAFLGKKVMGQLRSIAIAPSDSWTISDDVLDGEDGPFWETICAGLPALMHLEVVNSGNEIDEDFCRMSEDGPKEQADAIRKVFGKPELRVTFSGRDY